MRFDSVMGHWKPKPAWSRRYGAARDLDQPLPTITTGGAGSERPGCARPQMIEPIIVPMSNSSSAGVPRSVADPIRTVTTAKGGDQAMAVPLVAPYYGGGSGLTAASVAEPVPSVTTKARFGLAEPVLMRAGHGDSDGRDQASRVLDADAPMPALTDSNEMALAEPIVMRGNVGTGRTGDMRTASEPMPTITCSESLTLAEPFALPVTHHGDHRTHGMDEPLPTITRANRGELDLAQPAAELADEVVIDINYRMLHWREVARATSFDDEGEVYDFAGNATEITKQIGNAVPNRTAKALVMGLMRDAA